LAISAIFCQICEFEHFRHFGRFGRFGHGKGSISEPGRFLGDPTLGFPSESTRRWLGKMEEISEQIGGVPADFDADAGMWGFP